MARNCIALAVLCLVAVNCGRTELEPSLRLKMPPLVEGEFSSYRLTAGGDSLGFYATMLRQVQFKGTVALELTVKTRTSEGDVAKLDSSIVYLRRDSVTPLSSFRFVRTGEALATTAANYGHGTVAVSTFLAGEENQKLLPFGPLTFDIDQLSFLGRVLYIEPNKPVQINIVNPMGPPLGGSVREAEFSIAEDEQVVVPAGTFDCRKLQLKIGASTVQLWYEKTGTQRMIKYQAAGDVSGITMELLPVALD